MNPVLLQLGPLTVHWYGILIVTGAVIAAYICTIEAKRRGEDPDHVWNLLTLALIFGIIGARLYHVFSTPAGNFVGWAYYREHPIDIIAFWNGGFRGLGIYGAVAGGVLAFAIYCAYKRLSFPRWLDIATPGILLAQAIGRMGNFINQELYGPATNLPWAFRINPTFPCQEPAGSPMACGIPDRLNDAARQWYATNGFHPTFFYEALWNLLGFAIVMVRRPEAGQLAARRRCLLLLPHLVSRGPLLGRDVPSGCLAHGHLRHRPVDRDPPVCRRRGGIDHQSRAAAADEG